MNLKPFDLEKALAGEKVVTRNGIEVIEVLHFKKRKNFPVLILLPHYDDKHDTCDDEDIPAGQYMYACDEKGLSCAGKIYNVFMAPITKKLWIAIDKKTGQFGHNSTLAYESLAGLKEGLTFLDDIERFFIKEIEIEI